VDKLKLLTHPKCNLIMQVIKGEGLINIQYTYIDSDTLLDEKLRLFSKYEKVGIDTETVGLIKNDALDPWKGKIRLIQISSPENVVLLIDWFKISQYGKRLVKAFLEDSKRIKVFHNAKFDIKFLMVNGIKISNVIDTMLLNGVLEAGLKNSLKLDSIASKHLGLEISKKEQTSDWGADILSENQLKYSAIDSGILIPLADVLIKEVKMSELKDTLELELGALPAIVGMELNGIKVYIQKLNSLKRGLQNKQYALLEKLQEEIGVRFNPKSPKQVKNALAVININVKSTAKATLSKLAPNHKEIQTLLDYKEVTKQLEFARKIPKAINSNTGKLHSNYFQLGTATGRLSCTKFNLQQVPHIKSFRECFVPEEGNVFVISDYSQMQIRIAAEYSQDPVMKEIYQKGEDLHIITASVLTGKNMSDISSEERSLAKVLNFGMMFGMGADSLVKYAWSNYHVELTPEQASTFISKFYEKYADLKMWQNRVSNESLYATRTMLGRRRLFPGGGNYTQLINSPIQGVEADILKTVLSKLPNNLKDTSAKLVATIHDEIIVECKEQDGNTVLEIVKDTMEKAGQRFLKTIPVVAEASIASSWAGK
jgi:DNA polymerase I - 3''-5'' exonuclease and polymerase domains